MPYLLASELLDVMDKKGGRKELRAKMNHHGLYRWYATAEMLEELLCSKYVCIERPDGTIETPADLSFYKEYMDNKGNALTKCYNGTKYYGIYVGKTMRNEHSNEILYQRLVYQHICPRMRRLHNLDDDVSLKKKSRGTIASTFRHTVASLVAGDLTDAEMTDKFIDNLLVEFFCWPDDFSNVTASPFNDIKSREEEEIGKYILPLNIQKNNGSKLSDFVGRITPLRNTTQNSIYKRYGIGTYHQNIPMIFPNVP